MDKIRTIYDFKPSSESLRAAHDAARDMGVHTGRIGGTQYKGKIFKTDFANFRLLVDRLNEKYDRRESALRTLLSGKSERIT